MVMNRIQQLPEDILVLIWTILWRNVMEELKEKACFQQLPSLEFLQSLKRGDQIWYLSDWKWECARFLRLDRELFNNLPFYIVKPHPKVNPMRRISRIVLHDHKLPRQSHLYC